MKKNPNKLADLQREANSKTWVPNVESAEDRRKLAISVTKDVEKMVRSILDAHVYAAIIMYDMLSTLNIIHQPFIPLLKIIWREKYMPLTYMRSFFPYTDEPHQRQNGVDFYGHARTSQCRLDR